MTPIIPIVLMMLVGMLLATRITENPFRVRATIVESAANTFTQVSVTLPVAAVGGGKVQAIEVMKSSYNCSAPDLELSQSNAVTTVWHRDSDTVVRAQDSDNYIDGWRKSIQNVFTTSGSSTMETENPVIHDLTDGDGNGQVLMERTIFLAIQGSGNASAKTVESYLLCHLIDLTAEEVVIHAFTDD